MHTLILKESYEVDAITPEGKTTKKRIKVGDYKKTPNHVKTITGEVFRFATPEETPAMMRDLLDWEKNKVNTENFYPILTAIEFHYRFIRIHPFDDGNGRTARILMNFILMRAGYPPVIIRTNEKEKYYAALRQADAGLMTPFIEFINENLITSLDLMIKGAKGENIDDDNDLDKELILLEQKLKEKGSKYEVVKTAKSMTTLYKNSISILLEEYFNY